MLKTLEIQNFTCFPKAKLEFSPGLNVIVGENGTGKSHLLKLGYAVLRVLSNTLNDNTTKVVPLLLLDTLKNIFKSENVYNFLFYLYRFNGHECLIEVHFEQDDKIIFMLSDEEKDHITIKQLCNKNIQTIPLFIPSKEILSIFNGLESTLRNRDLQFDETFIDLSSKLGLPVFKGDKLKSIEAFYSNIENCIKKTISKNKDGYFIFKPILEKADYISEESIAVFADKCTVTASMSAEGHNKLGMLVYLIKNGSIGPGTVLFWDEPEANLNPKLLKALAEILIKLSSIMQIIIATHSLFLLRELEILQDQKKITNARYFGLQFNTNGVGVYVTQGDNVSDIGDIAALDEDLNQADRSLNAQAEAHDAHM